MLNEMKSASGGLNTRVASLAPVKSAFGGKTKLFIFLFLATSIIPNLLFAQFTQQGPKLVGTGGNGLGWSVAISSDGNTVIAGAPAGGGTVLIYTRNSGVWLQQGPPLVGTGGAGNFSQGTSVAISSDGNTIIEGGYNNTLGGTWVFTRTSGVWTQQGTKLLGTGGFSVNGHSLAISSDGNTAIIGSPITVGPDSGVVWVFTRSGSVWTQQGSKLLGIGGVGITQGNSVSISSDGNTAIEGGPDDNNGTGGVWVFIRNGGVWSQQGSMLFGTGSNYNGTSVAISSDGNTIIDGGQYAFGNYGAAWVFTRSGGVWTQQGSPLVGTGAVGHAQQGNSVSISSDGNTAIIGGYFDNTNAGAFWVFTRSAGVWTQQGSKLFGTDPIGTYVEQAFSVAISSDENTIIEGGPGDNVETGAIWVFYNSTVAITPISNEVPKSFGLSQNYPNPFNPTTKIEFDIPKSADVKLVLYNALGQEVSTLINAHYEPGAYSFEWNANSSPSGIYLYRITAGNYSETKKMILLK